MDGLNFVGVCKHTDSGSSIVWDGIWVIESSLVFQSGRLKCGLLWRVFSFVLADCGSLGHCDRSVSRRKWRMCSRNRSKLPGQGSPTDASYEAQEEWPVWKFQVMSETLTKWFIQVGAGDLRAGGGGVENASRYVVRDWVIKRATFKFVVWNSCQSSPSLSILFSFMFYHLLFNFHTLYEFRFSDWLICTTWHRVVAKQPHWRHYRGAILVV